jgi:predicted RNA-binding Zn ribbon-like protein
MTRSPAPGETESSALALVNTRTRHGDDLDAWLLAAGLQPGDRDETESLREAIRELFEARVEGRAPDPAALRRVNAVAAGAPGVTALRWDGAEPEAATAWNSPHAAVVADAIDVLTGPRAADLRACEAPGCVRLLLRDHARRQWCSVPCGDRVRAARYYRRHKAQPSP